MLRPSSRRRSRRERGQATVELALVLPILAVVGWAFFELALVARDNVLCVHAAREAARALAVGEDPVAAARNRSGLGSNLLVRVDTESGTATVELAIAPRLPLLGRLTGGATLQQSATMRRETLPARPVWPASLSLQRRLEEGEGHRLVERFVAVSAFGRLHA